MMLSKLLQQVSSSFELDDLLSLNVDGLVCAWVAALSGRAVNNAQSAEANEADLAILRAPSRNFNIPDLNSAEYRSLALKLAKTLENTDGGVGLAAPQVGINRRVVAVQRVDKEGEPVEVYANIFIEEVRGNLEAGPEGCLSVPDQRCDVMRYQDITIRYTDINSDRLDQPREIREDVSGFAAVIFQHEVDHLEGVLFIDKNLANLTLLDSQMLLILKNISH